MASPLSLLDSPHAFARDFARDRMPKGYLWDMADFVPNLLDSELTGRGGWTWGSTAMGGKVIGGIYAPYKASDKLLVIADNGQLYDIQLSVPNTATAVGAVPLCAQNPVMHRDWVFTFDTSQAATPRVIKNAAGAVSISAMAHATAPKARYGTVYKDRLVVGNIPGEEQRVQFSYPGFILKDDPNTGNPIAMKWDPLGYMDSSLAITGIGAMRSMILVFHAGSVERIRGSIPPGTDIASDMFLEPLFDRAGCTDARSIAYWNDNCLFADERGIHLTDGSIVRNLVSQAGLLFFWRQLYQQKLTLSAATYLDYYICTVRRTDGIAVTLICDLNRRSMFRFTNVDATSFIQSVGAQEKLWAGDGNAQRLAELSSCFFPVFGSGDIVDADGEAVLPFFETPWMRVGKEGRKRIRHAYLSYDVQHSGAPAPVIQVGFAETPIVTSYVTAGEVLPSVKYQRRKLAIGKQPYGISFRVKQVAPSAVTRIYDIGIEQEAKEPSAL